MMLISKKAHVSWPVKLMLFGFLFLTGVPDVQAQSIVVMVNGDPVTSYDLAQRQRFIALTSGLGRRMKAVMQSDATKQAYREFMMRERPGSREEAKKLQKKFIAQLQRNVVSRASHSARSKALEQLIDEKLMLQAAKKLKIAVADKDIDAMLKRMAEGGSRKLTLKQFQDQFRQQGINPNTLRRRLRAQNAWRQVIRRVYGSRVRAEISVSTVAVPKSGGNTIVDVRVVKFTLPRGSNQQAVANKLMEAESIRKRFTGCKQLAALLKHAGGVSVKAINKAKLSDFRGDVRATIEKAKAGQMTPPVIRDQVIESHAVCGKAVTVASGETKKKASDRQEKLQEVFQLYSRRHLKDLKDHARLDYPKNG